MRYTLYRGKGIIDDHDSYYLLDNLHGDYAGFIAHLPPDEMVVQLKGKESSFGYSKYNKDKLAQLEVVAQWEGINAK